MKQNGSLLPLLSLAAVALVGISTLEEIVEAREAAEFADSEDYRRMLRHDFPSVPMNDEAAEEEEAPTPVRSVEIRPPESYGDERRQQMPAWEPDPLPPYRSNSPDWRCDEWMDLAREVGWSEDQLPKLSYTIYRESRCRPEQHNPDDPMGGSNGLTQINQFWCKPTRYWPGGWLQAQGVLDHCDELYDAETNLRAALAIRNNSGWSPWGFSK